MQGRIGVEIGGTFTDPKRRRPDKIARDIDDGRITREYAAGHYGFSTGSGGGRES